MWCEITMYVDPKTRTTAALYGNDRAMQQVQARSATQAGNPNRQAYPAGAVLALVTWVQRDDPHWFRARIPAAPLSIDFVQVAAAGQAATYRRFAGAGLIEDHPTAREAAERMGFIIGLVPLRLP